MLRSTALGSVLSLLALAPLAAAGDVKDIRCGETVSRVIEKPGALDALTFAAKPGEVVSITAVASKDSSKLGALRWALFGAGVIVIPTSDGRESCTGQCESRPLPDLSPFTIRVLDADGDGTGAYHLTLEAVSETANGEPNGPPAPACARLRDGRPDGTRPIARGAPVAGTLDVEGETDTFALLAKRGETLEIVVAQSADLEHEGFTPRWELFDPLGARVRTSAQQETCDDLCRSDKLPLDGTFTIKVSDGGHDAPGTYRLGVRTADTVGSTTTTTSSTTSTTVGPLPQNPPAFTLDLTVGLPAPASGGGGLGSAAAVNGTRLILGAPHDGTAAPDGGAAFVVDVAAGPGFGRLLDTLIKPGTPAPGDLFGAAVAPVLSGILVGAPGDDVAAADAGAVYLFGVPGQTQATLIAPPTPAGGEEFGAAVAARGEDLAIGAPGTVRNSVADAGQAYVIDGATGAVRLTLAPPGVPGGDRFGATVLAVGDDLLVGAPGTDSSAGKAYLFDGDTGGLLLTLESPSPAAGDGFGGALAAIGGTIAVGAPGGADDPGSVHVFDGATGDLVRTFPNPSPQAGDRFGTTVSVGDPGLLVGAPGDGEQVPGGGAAYVFDLLTGDLLRTLRKPDPQPGDGFGAAVVAVGTQVLVGASADGSGSPGGGAGYLFDGANLDAVFRRRLTPAQFGGSLAAAGNDLLVGAPGAGTVSRVDGQTGEIIATIASPVAGDARFGFAVAGLAAEIVAGAPLQDGPHGGPDATHVGAAYVFAGDLPRLTLADPRPLAGNQFGWSLAASGADVLVGAPLTGERDTGVAYLFDGATGARRVTYRKATPVTGDFFGAAVAADGEQVLIGTPLDGASGESSGAAYLFARDSAALERVFQRPTPASGDLFGAAVAFASGRVVVGAPLADTTEIDAGAVYVYDRTSGALVSELRSPSPHANDQFGRALAVLGQNVLVGAPLVDGAGLDTGAAYLFDGATGALLQTLPNPAQGQFDHFGFAVAAVSGGLVVGAPGPSRLYRFDAGATGAVQDPPNRPAGTDDAEPEPPTAPVTPSPTVDGSAPAERPAGPESATAASSFRSAAIVPAGVASTCGNGVVESGEACDDGNAIDTDDCRADCTAPPCCTLDPDGDASCDDGNPCTDDRLDPTTGCQNVANDQCCVDDGGCNTGGKCRVCVGCFLYPFECCTTGSLCLPLSAECVGTACLEAASCECEGGLSCAGEAVPATSDRLFTAACDQLRLDESLATDGPRTRAELRATRSRIRKARQMTRKAAQVTRKAMHRRAVTRTCGSALLTRIKTVKQSIPRGRPLRRCLAR